MASSLRRPFAAYLIGQALDAATLVAVAVPFGMAGETNPVARALAEVVGVLPAAVLLKAAVAALSWAAASYLARSGHPRLATAGLLFGAVAGLAGAGTNLWALWVLTR